MKKFFLVFASFFSSVVLFAQDAAANDAWAHSRGSNGNNLVNNLTGNQIFVMCLGITLIIGAATKYKHGFPKKEEKK